MRNVVVLGSTGSIGVSTLNVLSQYSARFRVIGLAARANWQKLARQVRRFKPQRVALEKLDAAARLRRAGTEGVEVGEGAEAVEALAGWDRADIVVAAISGAAGLRASLAAVEGGKRLALANKESLVLAGALLTSAAARTGAELLPIDSEHSAIFQAMQSGRREEVRQLLLTASGGALRELPLEQFESVTPEQALRHPTWNMGPRITIDSATLMNKALEVIEARWLFDMPVDRIRVLLHPESIVHSLVEFRDGSVVAQLGLPDMRVPIQYSLTYPERWESNVTRLELEKLSQLTFRAPDPRRYPILELGYRCARHGGTSGAVLNAANEVALEHFLAGRLSFPGIARVIGAVVESHFQQAAASDSPDLAQVLQADRWARERARERIGALAP